MKGKELISEVEKVLKENEIPVKFLENNNAQLRIIGLLYSQYIFSSACKELPTAYSGEQVIECLKNAIYYLKKFNYDELNNIHISNIIIKAIKNQLIWNYPQVELNEELDELEI